MNLLNDLGVLGFMPQVVADAHGQAFLLGHFVGREDLMYAGRIDGHRFFHEHMLPRLDGRLELIGPKTGRRTQEHHVDVAGNRPLIRIQPHELAIVRHVDAVFVLDSRSAR